MHVLGIHMNAMPTTALSEEWGTLTGLWAFNKTDETLKMMLKKNDVPILLQDPLALMIHFILLLPVNIDKGVKCKKTQPIHRLIAFISRSQPTSTPS